MKLLISFCLVYSTFSYSSTNLNCKTVDSKNKFVLELGKKAKFSKTINLSPELTAVIYHDASSLSVRFMGKNSVKPKMLSRFSLNGPILNKLSENDSFTFSPSDNEDLKINNEIICSKKAF